MRKLLFLYLSSIIVFFISAQKIEKGNETIWQNKPGDLKLQWESQVFHLGNGYFGVSCYGGVPQEVMTLSEKTFWTKGPGDAPDYDFGIIPTEDVTIIDSIKKYTSNNQIDIADSLIYKHLKGDWSKLGALSSIGSMVMNFENHNGDYTNYERILDLKNSRVLIQYEINGIKYNREYFCSYPDRVMAVRITCDKPGALNLDLGINLMHKQRNPKKIIDTFNGKLTVSGNMDDNNRPYSVIFKMENEGGKILNGDSVLIAKGCNSVNIYYTVATNYTMTPPLFNGGNEKNITSEVIHSVNKYGYQKLKERHIKDYRNLYDRTSLHLDNQAQERVTLPTDQRLGYYIYDKDFSDLGLKELAFNFGKYFLISASRPGAMPAGLQGAWNNQYNAKWNGTYQLDMNVTQTYMFGNALNLSECQEPFIDYITLLSKVGEKAAKANYNSKGWVSFVIADLWGTSGIGNIFFHSNGWLSLIAWEQYDFERDKSYLKKIYPVLKGVAQFYHENLIEYKNTGKLVFWGSQSTEHSNSPVGTHAPNYQDIAFINETFENTTKAAKILSIDKNYTDRLMAARDSLMPYKIGRMGQFQEWVEDVDDPNCRHRHLSHLLALQPCKQINPYKQPEFKEAIKVTLRQRGDDDFVVLYRKDLCNSPLYPTTCEHEGLVFDNYTGQAWSRNARLSTWLRVQDGNRADKIYNDILSEATLPNMVAFQSCAHYGERPVQPTPFFLESIILAAGNVTEMVVQSQWGEIDLLPALPDKWKSGSIKGIRARGACTVDLIWSNGKLKQATLNSDKGGKYKVRYKNQVKEFTLNKDVPITIDSSLNIF